MEDKYLKGILIATIAILVGLAFWSTLGNSIGTLAKIQTSTNVTYTLPANGTTQDLTACGQLNTSAVTIYNYSGGSYGSTFDGNYTITQAAGSDGYLNTRIKWDSLAGTWVQAGYVANVSCTYQPKGYVTDGGGRAIALLIPILFALAIMVAAMPDLREWFKEKIAG